jgi:monoamine oxidase
VQLLEANERVGGRVLTLREPFADGLFAESGAEFISPGHQVTRQFLQAYGVVARARPAGPRLLHFGGQSQVGWSVADYGSGAKRQLELVERESRALGKLVSDAREPWACQSASELDGSSLAAWLDELQLDPPASTYESLWTTLDYGVEAETVSLLMYARDERLIAQSPGGETECALHGLDWLPRAMAAELGASVHLQTSATTLEQNSRSAAVHYQRNGAAGLIQAQYIVLAIPFSALRTLEVSPPLGPAHRTAVGGLRYNHVVKTHLQFRRRFWHDRGCTIGVLTDLPLQSAWDSTHAQAGQRGILTIYTAGQAAVALAALSHQQRVSNGLEQLEQIYPGCSKELELGVSVVWDHDPRIQGAYSYFGPGEMTRYAPWLARPAGRIHFAGEHTDPWQSTVNGALASGLRAADEVLKRASRR